MRFTLRQMPQNSRLFFLQTGRCFYLHMCSSLQFPNSRVLVLDTLFQYIAFSTFFNQLLLDLLHALLNSRALLLLIAGLDPGRAYDRIVRRDSCSCH